MLGFLTGLSIGGAIISDANGSAFLNTFLGIFVGFVLGLVFAVIAYLYYYVAVVVMAGGLGYWAGSGFVLLLGFNPGMLSAVIGIAVGIFIGLLAILSNAPKYVLIALTAIAGSAATIGGILLLFNQIPLATYSYTTAHVAISNSFVWTVAALALLILGMVSQIRTTAEYDFETWATGGETHHIPPTPTTHISGVH
jgi:hypothetical protein